MYGSTFADLWAGTNLVEVKAVWAESLGCFEIEVIRLALETCLSDSPRAPTLPVFFGFCKQHARSRPRPVIVDNTPGVPMPPHVREQFDRFLRDHVIHVPGGRQWP